MDPHLVSVGLPWNLIGQVWGFSDATFQAASLVGVLGLGLVAVLAAGAPAALAGSGSSRWAPLAVSAGLVAIVAVFGFVRLSGQRTRRFPMSACGWCRPLSRRP